MSAEFPSCQRQFQIWLYTVGHSRLLLRSTKSMEIATQIDILFKDVGGVCLPTLLNGMQIDIADDNHILPTTLANVSLLGRKIFTVKGCDYSGYVIAGAMGWSEDQGEYDDPSTLLE